MYRAIAEGEYLLDTFDGNLVQSRSYAACWWPSTPINWLWMVVMAGKTFHHLSYTVASFHTTYFSWVEDLIRDNTKSRPVRSV